MIPRSLYRLGLVLTMVLPLKLSAETCNESAVSIFFGNGMLNDFDDAAKGTTELKLALTPRLPPDRDFVFSTSYNQNETAWTQMLQLLLQKGEDVLSLFAWVSSPSLAPDWFREAVNELTLKMSDAVYVKDSDLQTHLGDYRRALAAQRKVLIMAHSQGNFYANQAHRRLDSESVGIVAIGTPASYVSGDGLWVTLFFDMLINLVRKTFPTTLPGLTINVNFGLDASGHTFTGSYLRGDVSRESILGGALKQIAALAPPGCIAMPPALPPCEAGVCHDDLGNPIDGAASIGDPHLRSYDGLHFDFQGAGEYIYTQSASQDLIIQGRLEAFGAHVSRNTALAIKMGKQRIGFYTAADDLAVLLDGKVVNFEKGIVEVDEGAIYQSSSRPHRYTAVWSDGSQMRLKRRGPYIDMEVSLAPARRGHVGGLLGDFNGEIANDISLSTGETIGLDEMSFKNLYQTFGNSWRVTDESTLFDYFGSESRAGFVNPDFPFFPLDTRDLEADPAALGLKDAKEHCLPLSGRPAFEACVLDTTMFGIFGNLEAYWRMPTPKARLIMSKPPRVFIEAPVQGLISKGNVLVRGRIEPADKVRSLELGINGGKPLDFTSSLKDQAFSLTLPNEALREGDNSALIFVEDSLGNRSSARINIVINKDAAPEAGSDVIVVNDLNIFDDTHISRESNVTFVKNLVNFTASGGRKSHADRVLFSVGHESRCDVGCRSSFTTLKKTIQDTGAKVEEIAPAAGTLTSIPEDVRLIFLLTPMVPYTTAEISAFKKFAADGGRIVFIGENESWYGKGIAIENSFLQSMGAQLENKGGTVLEGMTVLRPSAGSVHQILKDVPSILTNRVSTIKLGPQDYPLFLDKTGTHIVVAVAQINVNANPIQPRRLDYRPAPFPRGPAGDEPRAQVPIYEPLSERLRLSLTSGYNGITRIYVEVVPCAFFRVGLGRV